MPRLQLTFTPPPASHVARRDPAAQFSRRFSDEWRCIFAR